MPIILYPKHFFASAICLFIGQNTNEKRKKIFFKNFRGPKCFFSDTFLSISRQAKKF